MMDEYSYDGFGRQHLFMVYLRALESALRPGATYDTQRLTRAIGIMWLPREQREEALTRYKSTPTYCECPDRANGFVCKHRMARTLELRARQLAEKDGAQAAYTIGPAGWEVVRPREKVGA